MADFENLIRKGICSDAGRLLLPAVPGLAVGALTSWSGPGAIAAGTGTGMVMSSAQQQFCDGRIDPLQVVIGGVVGAGGAAIRLAGRAAVATAGTSVAAKPELLQRSGFENVQLSAGMREQLLKLDNAFAPYREGREKLDRLLHIVKRGAEQLIYERNFDYKDAVVDATRRAAISHAADAIKSGPPKDPTLLARYFAHSLERLAEHNQELRPQVEVAKKVLGLVATHFQKKFEAKWGG